MTSLYIRWKACIWNSEICVDRYNQDGNIFTVVCFSYITVKTVGWKFIWTHLALFCKKGFVFYKAVDWKVVSECLILSSMYQCAIYYHESFKLAGLCYTYDLHWFRKYIECTLDFVLNLHSINTKSDIVA